MSKITAINPRRVWDSRGKPTIEVEITLEDGACGRAIAPAGASKGSHESFELRDKTAFLNGLDVQNAIQGIIKEINPALIGRDAEDQESIDKMLIELDGTSNKSRLGANAIVAVSMATLHAAAASAKLPLWKYLSNGKLVMMPLPQIQIFGGGAHANRRIDIQDLMVIAVGAESFQQALSMTAEVYHAAGEIMKKRGFLAGVADEGGWWPNFDSNEHALDTLVETIESAGYIPGKDISIALDIAASEFSSNGKYKLALNNLEMDSSQMCDYMLGWIDRYPIVSIEDPFAEDDDDGFIAFTKAAGSRIQIVGDDYLVTNASRVKEAASRKACNAVLIKPNQVGTITETIQTVNAAKSAGFPTIISARSGETEDTTIVHLAVGLNAGQLKVGSFSRSERMAKWNEGIRIETGNGNALDFSSAKVLAGLQVIAK